VATKDAFKQGMQNQGEWKWCQGGNYTVKSSYEGLVITELVQNDLAQIHHTQECLYHLDA